MTAGPLDDMQRCSKCHCYDFKGKKHTCPDWMPHLSKSGKAISKRGGDDE